MIGRLTSIACALVLSCFAKSALGVEVDAATLSRPGASIGSQALLYVPAYNGNVINVYAAGVPKPKLLEQLAVGGSFFPLAVSVDRYSGNVYVLEVYGFIGEFTRGQTSPFRTITGPSGFHATLIAAAKGGSLFLLGTQNHSGPAIMQITPSGTVLRSILLPKGVYNAIASDANGNLFVSTSTDVLVYAPGATAPTSTLSQPYAPAGLFVNRQGQLLVGFPSADMVAIESLPSGKVLRTIATVGAGDYIALDEAVNYLYAVDAEAGTLQLYGYDGGRPIGFFSNSYEGIAIDPGPAYR